MPECEANFNAQNELVLDNCSNGGAGLTPSAKLSCPQEQGSLASQKEHTEGRENTHEVKGIVVKSLVNVDYDTRS